MKRFPIRLITSYQLCILGLLLPILFAACATYRPPTPIPHAFKPELLGLPRKVFVTEKKPIEAPAPFIIKPLWQVVVQQEGGALRWLRFNLLGAPDARQILEDGRWRNDGFIQPNPEAREMFAALLFAWMPKAALDEAYGVGRWVYRLSDNRHYAEMDFLTDEGAEKPRWTVIWPEAHQEDVFTIVRHRDGRHWVVRPVPEVFSGSPNPRMPE